MRALGMLAIFTLLTQAVFVGVFAMRTGRLPSAEMGLALKSMAGEPLPTGKKEKKSERNAPEAEPSYEEVLAQRADELQEIRRQKKEAQSLLQLAEAKVAEVKRMQQEVQARRKQLDVEIDEKLKIAIAAGKKTVLSLLEAVKPRQAGEFLLSVPDEELVLELVQQLEPSSAAKVFKEFKQPSEQRRLNDWLGKLSQGDPEAARLRSAQAGGGESKGSTAPP